MVSPPCSPAEMSICWVKGEALLQGSWIQILGFFPNSFPQLLSAASRAGPLPSWLCRIEGLSANPCSIRRKAKYLFLSHAR